jgi:hypothetical protein
VAGGAASYSIPLTGFKIYNNTLVDNDENYRFNTAYSTADWEVYIRNNISLSIDGDSVNIEPGDCNFSGITEWDNNAWSADLTGNCVADSGVNNGNIENASIALAKTSGWRTMTAGAVTGQEFDLQAGSAANRAGTDLGNSLNYGQEAKTADYTAFPINVDPIDFDDYGWSIGADGGGVNYYVDCSAFSGSCGGSGTYADPWTCTGEITGLSNGDDLWFANGTTCDRTGNVEMTSNITITWKGTATTQPGLSEIGCYDNGDADVDDCSPLTRPILDGEDAIPGSSCTYTTCYSGIFFSQVDGTEYIKIKDLHIKSAGGYGISFDYKSPGDSFDYLYVDNNYIEDSYRDAVFFDAVVNGEITNNTVVGNCKVQEPGGRRLGTSIQLSNLWQPITNNSLLVSGNEIDGAGVCREGIGIYKGIQNAIIENNVVYDHQVVQIYPSGSCDDCIVRNNLLYSSDPTDSDKDGSGIYYLWEDTAGTGNCNNYAGTEDNMQIYGNLIAAVNRGIWVSADTCDDAPHNLGPINAKVYNNTIVDTFQYNIILVKMSSSSGNLIKNNISEVITGDGVHVYDCDPPGWTWDTNLWYGGSLPSGTPAGDDCEINEVNGDPKLNDPANWRALSNPTGREFSLQSDSAAIDRALSIAGYNSRITWSDFTRSPPAVTVEDVVDVPSAETPDIGAWEHIFNAGKYSGR